MSVKSEVLKELELHRETSLSGQELANHLGVTRAAVWKAIHALQEEGYAVDAANGKGYCLKGESDVLSKEGILPELAQRYRQNEICVYKCIDSTNQEVKRRALEGAKQGLVILAEEQTAGKGRRGRNFFSPSGTGIYMSVLFRPEGNQTDVVLVTTAASVAVCRAIRKTLGVEPEIKWVNDVYLHGRKVCGILTEAVSDFESGRFDMVVVGIGINFRMPQEKIPDELQDIVGAICMAEKKVPRNTLVAAILNELFELYDNLSERTFMEDYKKWSNVIGKDVRFSSGETWINATAIDIDCDGGLIVQIEDGDTKVLRTGEISLRLR